MGPPQVRPTQRQDVLCHDRPAAPTGKQRVRLSCTPDPEWVAPFYFQCVGFASMPGQFLGRRLSRQQGGAILLMSGWRSVDRAGCNVPLIPTFPVNQLTFWKTPYTSSLLRKEGRRPCSQSRTVAAQCHGCAADSKGVLPTLSFLQQPHMRNQGLLLL